MNVVWVIIAGLLGCCAIGVLIECFNGKPSSKWGWFEWVVIVGAVIMLLQNPGCRKALQSTGRDLDDPYEYKGRQAMV